MGNFVNLNKSNKRLAIGMCIKMGERSLNHDGGERIRFNRNEFNLVLTDNEDESKKAKQKAKRITMKFSPNGICISCAGTVPSCPRHNGRR